MSDSLARMERALAALLAQHAPDTSMRTLAWSKGETRVLELGEGPPLFLVHGGLGSVLDWVPALPRFARHHRVIAVDRPGHGFASPFDYRGVDLAAHGEEFLGEMLDTLGLDAVDLVGSSIGGYLTVAFALARPQRVSKLVLMGKPVGCNRRTPGPLRLLGMPLIGRPLAKLLMSSPTPRANRKFWGDILVANAAALDDALIDADCAHQTRNLSSLVSLIRRVAGPTGVRRELILGEKWRDLPMPILLLWGEHDAFGGPREAEVITSRNEGAQLVEIPGAGHMPWLDEPAHVAAALERFLAASPRAPASLG